MIILSGLPVYIFMFQTQWVKPIKIIYWKLWACFKCEKICPPFRPGDGRARLYTSCHWAKDWVHTGWVASPTQGHTEYEREHAHSLLRTIQGNQETQHACFWMVGGSWSTQREPMYAQGEHANSTQKGLSQDSNQEPSCCKVTVLTITPPCSPNCNPIY